MAAIISGAALMISTLFLYTNPIDGEAILLIPKILWIYAVVAISSSKEEQYKKRQDKGISSVISFMTFYVAVSTILFGIILIARGEGTSSLMGIVPRFNGGWFDSNYYAFLLTSFSN